MGNGMGPRLVVAFGAPLIGLVLAASGAAAKDPTIEIVGANYGYAGDDKGTNKKDPSDDLKKLCEGKISCTFTVKNETFSAHPPVDPAPGEDKRIVYTYKCGDVTYRDSAAEGRRARLSCKNPASPILPPPPPK